MKPMLLSIFPPKEQSAAMSELSLWRQVSRALCMTYYHVTHTWRTRDETDSIQCSKWFAAKSRYLDEFARNSIFNIKFKPRMISLRCPGRATIPWLVSRTFRLKETDQRPFPNLHNVRDLWAYKRYVSARLVPRLSFRRQERKRSESLRTRLSSRKLNKNTGWPEGLANLFYSQVHANVKSHFKATARTAVNHKTYVRWRLGGQTVKNLCGPKVSAIIASVHNFWLNGRRK